MFCLAYNLEKGLFLHYNGNGNLNVSKKESDILKDIEKSYKNNHRRGYEASMSTAIHFITMKPIVVKLPESLDEIMDLLVRGEEGGLAVSSLSGIASRGTQGLQVKPEEAQKLIDSGTVPDLI